MEEANKYLTDRIKAVCKEKGYSYVQVAEKSGLPKREWRAWFIDK